MSGASLPITGVMPGRELDKRGEAKAVGTLGPGAGGGESLGGGRGGGASKIGKKRGRA